MLTIFLVTLAMIGAMVAIYFVCFFVMCLVVRVDEKRFLSSQQATTKEQAEVEEGT